MIVRILVSSQNYYCTLSCSNLRRPRTIPLLWSILPAWQSFQYIPSPSPSSSWNRQSRRFQRVGEENGERADSSDGGRERVDDQRLSARVDKQQKGVRVDTEEDRSVQYLWLQASIASRTSAGRRRLFLFFLSSISHPRKLGNLGFCIMLDCRF